MKFRLEFFKLDCTARRQGKLRINIGEKFFAVNLILTL